ncbi:MAG: hypothetical protein JO002_10825 [Burkholderiaceae bacterium]|nr:hypothetical protein [Burkholderiaceae bacterium]
MKKQFALAALTAVTLLAACGGNGNQTLPEPGTYPNNTTTVPNTATASGFSVSVFVQAPQSTYKPDSIVQYNNTVFIAYQKAGDVKDGSVPGLTNDIVQYDLYGNPLKTYTVPGHCDGLMVKDANTLWAMSNEDGNPLLTVISLSGGTQTTYSPTVPTAHGGGFDDMQQINGTVYVSASNPTTPGAAPTVDTLTLNANGKTFDVAPVLAGNAQAVDITPSVGGSPNPTYNTPVTLALTDPDSEAITPAGDLMLDSQADGKLVFIHNPGPSQTVSVLSLTLFNDKDGPTLPVDDTRWVPAAGPVGKTFMLFTDASNTTYRVDGPFVTGAAYSAGQGQVMSLDTKTGYLTPFVTGIGVPTALHDPHGILFVAL